MNKKSSDLKVFWYRLLKIEIVGVKSMLVYVSKVWLLKFIIRKLIEIIIVIKICIIILFVCVYDLKVCILKFFY